MRSALLAAIACALAVAPLAVMAYSWGPFQRVDLRGFMHLRHEEGPIHAFATVFVNFGDLAALVVFLAVACAIGLRHGRRREVIAAIIVVVGANLTTQLLKTTLEHARHKAVEHGVELPWPNSFPSGHTTAAASIAVALLLVVPAVHRGVAAVLGLALTGAVGISVVVLGWHYPSDVLGGLLVVGAWSFAVLAWLGSRRGPDRASSTQEHRRPAHLAVSTD